MHPWTTQQLGGSGFPSSVEKTAERWLGFCLVLLISAGTATGKVWELNWKAYSSADPQWSRVTNMP